MLSNSSKVWVKSSFQLASLRFDSGVHHIYSTNMQENIMSYLGKTRLMPFTGQDAKEMLGRAEITITRTGQQTWVVLLSFHSLLPMFFLLGYRFNWKSAVLFRFLTSILSKEIFCYWGIPSTSCLLSTRSSNLRIGRSINVMKSHWIHVSRGAEAWLQASFWPCEHARTTQSSSAKVSSVECMYKIWCIYIYIYIMSI